MTGKVTIHEAVKTLIDSCKERADSFELKYVELLDEAK